MTATVKLGDCREVLAQFAPSSFDAVVTDPPYGLRFMGQAWDRAVPGPAFWEAAQRVAKPGAFLLAFGGTRTWHRLACAIEDAGWVIRDCLLWLYGQGFPKSRRSLKPAWEPILLAQNPGAPSALQVDACRIPAASKGGYVNGPGTRVPGAARTTDGFAQRSGDPCDGKGRWPANVVLDEEAAVALDVQSGVLTSGFSAGYVGPYTAGAYKETIYADSGGASRFFYCAKAAPSERTHDGRVENAHKTVKPVALMRWLVRLVTPPGGHVLDHFCGSGTTGVACLEEGLAFTGIDADPAATLTTWRRLRETELAGRARSRDDCRPLA